MVIQRWQSVLLLIAAVMMGCFSFLSLGQIQMPDFTLDFTAMGFFVEGELTGPMPAGYPQYTWWFFAVSLLSALIPLINIFLFKNMNRQKTLCMVEALLIVTVTAIGAILGYRANGEYTVSWSTLVIAPLIALVADLYAARRIRHDQNLLRSADRLR